MSHKKTFENWREFLVEQKEPEDSETDNYIETGPISSFLDDVLKKIEKEAEELPADEFMLADAPFKKFSKKPRENKDITALLIHESDAFGDVDKFVRGLNNREGGLSVNHLVMQDGDVHELIPGEYATIHAPGWNRVSIGIEVHHHLGTKKYEGQKPISGPWTLNKPYYMPTLEQLEATYQLCLSLCREFEIPLRVSNVVDDKFDMEMPYEVVKGEYLTYSKGHEKEGQIRTYKSGPRKGKKIPKTLALPKIKVGVNKGIIAHGACQGNRSDGLVPCYYMALRLRGLNPNDARAKTEKDFNKNKKTIRHLKGSQMQLPPSQFSSDYRDIADQLFHDPRTSDFDPTKR